MMRSSVPIDWITLATRPPDFDVIVVGSGATGGWAAKTFAEAGFTTAVLEAGAMLSSEEREWVDRYHAQVQEIVGAQLDGEAMAWLEAQCRPLQESR